MLLAESKAHRFAPMVVIGTMLVQIVTHLAWLLISAHSGQVAIPWMMNQGRTLFGDVLEQHAPATSVIAALAMRLLPNVEPVLVTRLLNLLLVLALTGLIFSLARRLAGTFAGLIAALIWFWWEPIYGNVMFYFDSLLGLLVVLALLAWTMLSKRRPGWLAPLVAGLLMGAATIAKQYAWGGIVLFTLWLFFFERRRLSVFVIAALLLPTLSVLVVTLQGNFQEYLYWNWLFNFSGLMQNLLPEGSFVQKLVLSNLFVAPFVLLALRRPEGEAGQKPLYLLIGLLWLSCTADLLPRFNLVQSMAHLPLACVMGGIVIAWLLSDQPRLWWRQMRAAEAVLMGMLLILLVGWLWSGAAAYVPSSLGRADIPAYDEFKPLTTRLRALAQPGDTLFVLPETDSTPQIHPMSGLLPPATWIKGWYWYLEAPGIVNQLLTQWASTPPTYIVYFPDLISVGQPGIARMVDFMNAHYQQIETVKAILFHGDALIYQHMG